MWQSNCYPEIRETRFVSFLVSHIKKEKEEINKQEKGKKKRKKEKKKKEEKLIDLNMLIIA